jgi:hypothetical protein
LFGGDHLPTTPASNLSKGVCQYADHEQGGKEPTLENKEDKEGKIIAGLCRVANMIEKAKMIV